MLSFRNKRALETESSDIWRYRTINNVKILPNMNDITRFIDGICRTLKIDKYPGGTQFIEKFRDSTRHIQNVHMDEFTYVNENDELCYFVLVVQPDRDGKSTKVIYTQHTLSKSALNNSYSDEVVIEKQNPLEWLKRRAFNELSLTVPANHELMYKLPDYPTIDEPKCPIHKDANENNLTAKEITQIIEKSEYNGSFQGWRYIPINKTKDSRLFLENVPEIREYIESCNQSGKISTDLEERIKNLKAPSQISYPFTHENKPGALIILIQPAGSGKIIEMACRFQIYDVRKSS